MQHHFLFCDLWERLKEEETLQPNGGKLHSFCAVVVFYPSISMEPVVSPGFSFCLSFLGMNVSQAAVFRFSMNFHMNAFSPSRMRDNFLVRFRFLRGLLQDGKCSLFCWLSFPSVLPPHQTNVCVLLRPRDLATKYCPTSVEKWPYLVSHSHQNATFYRNGTKRVCVVLPLASRRPVGYHHTLHQYRELNLPPRLFVSLPCCLSSLWPPLP